VLVVDSITRLGPEAAGAVAIAASHGAVYPAYLAARAGLRGVVLHDAGIGLDQAGIAGLAYLDALRQPAATVAHTSARIGDGGDLARRGVISRVNATAAAVGCSPGMGALDCAHRFEQVTLAAVSVPDHLEARYVLRAQPGMTPVIGLDSISLARLTDATAVLVSGSHGGLLGGVAASALKVDAIGAIYNDAGVGVDDAGIGRLVALDRRGLPAATVDAFTARIGSARSTWESGVISHVNRTAATRGGRPGMSCQELVATLSKADQHTLSKGD
jgi:hypothetical protein